MTCSHISLFPFHSCAPATPLDTCEGPLVSVKQGRCTLHSMFKKHKSDDIFSHSISIQGTHIVTDVLREHTITKRHMFSHSITIQGEHIVTDVLREHTITKRHKLYDMFSHSNSIQGAHIVTDVLREHTITKRHMSCDMFSHFISHSRGTHRY
jgi:hypothetical protein